MEKVDRVIVIDGEAPESSSDEGNQDKSVFIPPFRSINFGCFIYVYMCLFHVLLVRQGF